MTYYIRFIKGGEIRRGASWELDDLLDDHILGFLENHPGMFYDVVIED